MTEQGMTREEAKEFLIDISYKLGNISIEYLTEKDGEKMREAIETLEQEKSETVTEFADRCRECGAKYGKLLKQEPCDDAISRQAVLDKKELVELEDGQSFYCISPEDVETLPPVNPQPKTGEGE